MPRLERAYVDLSRPLPAFQFEVNVPETGLRLDVLLRRHYPWRSRTHFQGLVERGDVTVNGARAKASQRVRSGDRVAVRLPADPAAPEREDDGDLVILYEDDSVVAVDKPSGMTAHPVGRIRHGTLINKLHARYRRDRPGEDVVPRLGHRLDKDTSGVLLCVKGRAVDAAVTELFTRRRVQKTYLALVAGRPAATCGVIDAPLSGDPDGDTLLAMRVSPEGQPARTRWRVLETYARHALLELEPLTGRTHQLRVHLRHLGHPILCDHLYGDLRPLWRSTLDVRSAAGADVVLLERLALHARRLVLPHPVSGETLTLESPVPPDVRRAIAALRASSHMDPAAPIGGETCR